MARPMAIFPSETYEEVVGVTGRSVLLEAAFRWPPSLPELRTNMVMLLDLVNVALLKVAS